MIPEVVEYLESETQEGRFLGTQRKLRSRKGLEGGRVERKQTFLMPYEEASGPLYPASRATVGKREGSGLTHL